MQNDESTITSQARPAPWNKGKLIGAKPPLRAKQVWSIRTKLQVEGRIRDLAMFNLAIDRQSLYLAGASSALSCGSQDRRAMTEDRGRRMVASDSFAEFLREQLAPLGRLTMRRMFGKTGVFCDGVMFGMVTDDTLYFRVDDHNRAAFKEAESFPPLSYEKKGCSIDLSFWRAPERLFDEPDELVTWARAALAAARRVAAKRERTAPRRKSKPTQRY